MNCHNCGKELNSWEKRCSKALAYQNAVCEKCISDEYGKTIDELRATMEHFFGMRPCQGI